MTMLAVRSRARSIVQLVMMLLVVTLTACRNDGEVSARHAAEHVSELAGVIKSDVEEVRQGLPEGAKVLAKFWPEQGAAEEDTKVTFKALEKAHGGVQNLRLAKSTFFALTNLQGVVLRSEAEQDVLAGKALFASFPGLDKAVNQYVETQGALVDLDGVKGKPDGQWLAATPVPTAQGNHGLYVTGWAWSSYAYRLEFALRGSVRSKIAKAESPEKEPLLYVYLIVGDKVIGAPVSPEINAQVIAERKVLGNLQPGQPYSVQLDITGRAFGLGAMKVPDLGNDVAVAVLRSET
jgi:hypothetical protein